MLKDERGLENRCPEEEAVVFMLVLELGKQRLAGGMREAADDEGRGLVCVLLVGVIWQAGMNAAEGLLSYSSLPMELPTP